MQDRFAARQERPCAARLFHDADPPASARIGGCAWPRTARRSSSPTSWASWRATRASMSPTAPRTSPPARCSSPPWSTASSACGSAPAPSICRTRIRRRWPARSPCSITCWRAASISASAPAGCCPMPRCSAISTPTATRCSSRPSTRCWPSGPARRHTIWTANTGRSPRRAPPSARSARARSPSRCRRPHPPIIVTAVAPFSQGVTEAAARGWDPISANFLMPVWVKSHWPKYVEGCRKAGRPADPANWRVAKSIFVAEDDKTARDYATAANSPYRQYYGSLGTKLIRNGRAELFKTSRDMPDSDVTLDLICDKLVIWGSPKKVADEILEIPRGGRRVRHAALCRQGLARPRPRPPLHDLAGRAGDAAGQLRAGQEQARGGVVSRSAFAGFSADFPGIEMQRGASTDAPLAC